MTNQISVFYTSRWQREVREWGPWQSSVACVTIWRMTQIEVPVDVRSLHQDCGYSPCSPTPVSRSSPGIQQRKKQSYCLLSFIYYYIYSDIWNLEVKLPSSCIMFYLLAFMGSGFKVAQSQLYISNMKDVLKIKKKTRGRMKCSRLSSLPTRFVTPRTRTKQNPITINGHQHPTVALLWSPINPQSPWYLLWQWSK